MSKEANELRDFWLTREGSQKGQYRLGYHEAGVLFQRIGDLETQQRGVVPGVMRCAKCGFRLVRTNLHVNNGTTSSGDNKTEPCPNKCGPLWPETWEQRARESERLMDELLTLAIKHIDMTALRISHPTDWQRLIPWGHL